MISSQNKKRFALIFLVVFLFTSTFTIFTPQKAQAVPVEDILGFPVTAGKWLWERLETVFGKTFTEVMSTAFKRSYQMFMENIAYDAATYLAEGFKGGHATWETMNWGDFLTNAGRSAAVEFVDSALTSPAFKDIGFDICQPPGGIEFKLKLGIKLDNKDKPEPRCSYDDISKKWGKFSEDLKENPLSMVKLNDQSLKKIGQGMGAGSDASPDEVRAKLLQTFIDVKQTDLGVAQFMEEQLEAEKGKAKTIAEVNRKDPDGPKSVEYKITKDVKIPAAVAGKKLDQLQEVNQKAAEMTSDSIGANIASIFLNTLLTKSINNMLYQLMTPYPPQYNENRDNDKNLYNDPGDSGSKNIIEQTFETIQQISASISSPSNIDIITEMEMDLGKAIMGEMNNGTIDADFAEILRRAQGGETLILREAIKQNLIDDSKWFGYIDVASQDPKEPSVDNGFSYNNLKKLVKNRVVSVGWLFAAEVIKEKKGKIKGCSSRGCTLKDVIDQYDKSGTYKINGENYKNEYCGWRSISAEPYFLDINNKSNCLAVDIVGATTTWSGGDDSIAGNCYKYEDDNGDAIIDNVSAVVANQEICEGYEPVFDDVSGYYYHEWVPGGCMIIEEDESPLCHLVDPDTVLKAPEQQCGARGYYSILETNDSFNRQEDCADVQHCVQEDDQGKCVGGYDYCLKEENIWRFNGDACSPQFSSCQTLVDDEGKEESYLTNTLKDCPQEEVGCRDYIVEKEKINNQYVWDNEASRLYFNNSVEECDDGDEGCSEFIEIEPGVNLIPNGSFEINENDDSIPDGWKANGDVGDWEYSSEEGIRNSSAVKVPYTLDFVYGEVYQDYFMIEPNETYTISAFAKFAEGGNDTRVVITLCDDTNGCGNDSTAVATTTGLADPCIIGYGGHPQNIDLRFFPGDTDYNRGSCSFITNSEVKRAKINISAMKSALAVPETWIWFDNIQLEKGKDPTSYKEYGLGGEVYYKLAPDYLNCENYDLNLYNCAQEYHPCCEYIKYCSVEDLGCSAYQPVNDDPFVPAVLQNEDYCVEECNNYQTFSQAPSYFDQLEDININSMDRNFIPETAQDCSEPSCELFTNIDDLERGAESKKYYSFVRQCVKPEEVAIELYYTWEGSDTSAFQLKTWKLLASTKADPFNDGVGGYAPCTNVELGGSICEDFYLAEDDTNIEKCDPDENLDCRTFYDAEAFPHNRLLSKTIPITEECINLRRELSNQTYKIAPSMSQTCSASNVGCLTYKGNYSDNVRNIFMADFESGSISGWMADAFKADGAIINNSAHLKPASEAIQYNGNSMKAWINGNDPRSLRISYNLTEAGVNIFSNKQYSLSFWAKAFADDNAGDDNLASSYSFEPEDVSLIFDDNLSVINDEWLLYKYDIVDLQTAINGDVILSFEININNYFPDVDYSGFYIDNIILKGFTNSFNKIKDSWETPKICLEKNYLGCQEYEDLDNNTLYLYQFTDLCPEENIGCTAMIDTQNSSMPWQQTFNAYCNDDGDDCNLGKYYYRGFKDVWDVNIATSTAIIEKDQLVYLVKDDTYSCSQFNKGCQEMSFINNDGQNQNIYLLNNPDYYIAHDLYGQNQNILCLGEYKNCIAFNTTEGSKLFKIHPRNLVCEYQAEDLQSSKLAGFYTSEGENCRGLLYNQDYEVFTSSITEDWKPYGNYNNQYAALCPAEENKCTTFIDPLDNLDLKDDVYKRLAFSLNYNHPSEWQQAIWENDGKISNFTTNNISYHPASDPDDYDGLHVNLEDDKNLLIYRGPDYDKEAFFFNVESTETYRLSARVKLEGADSVMTFLSCRGSKNSDFDNYFVAEDEYPGDNSIPYAFPSTKSNYITNDTEDWQYIYGLYEVLPDAHYCNLAFYIKDSSTAGVDSKFTIADINLERLEGDYHYLDNDQLDDTSCTSPNLKEGCVLFNSLNESSLKWNYQASYDEDRLAPGGSRAPSDVNSLLKVTRDKQCAEWLTCGAQLKTIDPTSGQQKDACVSLIACDELSVDEAGVCAHPFLNGQDSQPLTLDYYQKVRGRADWADLDYSGYSIPGLYPLDSLIPTEVVINNTTSTVLSHLVVKQNSDYQPFVYKLGIGVNNYLQDIYSQPASATKEANWGSNLTNGQGFVDKSCRLYPEKDSPFPWLAGTDIITEATATGTDDAPYVDIVGQSPNFANANICQTGSGSNLDDAYSFAEGKDCECHYIKANYGTETLYFPYDYGSIHVPSEISIDYGGGVGDLKRRNITQYLGWKGFCLDEEKSLFINNTESLSKNQQDYRCLTWYPVDLLSGEIDSYAASQEADVSFGKTDVNDKLCVVGEDWTATEDRFYCGHFSTTGYCNVIALIPEGSKLNLENYNPDSPQDIHDKILFGNNDFGGATWLVKSPTNLIFVPNATDIVENGQNLSIIYRSTNNHPDDDTDDVGYVNEEKKYKAFDDFHWDYTEDNDLFDELAILFDTPTGKIEKYYWDERVAASGETITSTLESRPAIYFDYPYSYRTTGAECGDECPQAKSEANDCDANHHQVRIDCDKSSSNCGFSWWRDARRNCNPRNYNYYVNFDFEYVPADMYCGKCSNNCGGDAGEGLVCLRGNSYYYDVQQIYVDQGSIAGCQTEVVAQFGVSLGITSSEALNDCNYVACMENAESIIGDIGIDHYCYEYVDGSGEACGKYIQEEDESGNNLIISSANMQQEYLDCVVNTPLIADSSVECIEDWKCWMFHPGVCSASQCESFFDPQDFTDITGLEDCEPDCAKTCKTYITLDGAIYNSNNFYLNWLTPDAILNGGTVEEVCTPDEASNICPDVLSGYSDNYNSEEWIRHSQISIGRDPSATIWNNIYPPFSSNVIEAPSPQDKRNIILADQGTGEKFNNYYSDLNASPAENLEKAKDRLEKVLVKVPNDNFYEYDGDSGTWPHPIWTDPYWNRTEVKEPFIQSVVYDERYEFSEGDSGISVNSTHGQHIIEKEGNLYAYLMFYGYTATGTAPIQEIVINWGGSDQLALAGPFKNRKHDCIRRCGTSYRDAFIEDIGPECANHSDCSEENDSCFALTWGDHEDACVEDNLIKEQDGYFSYSYVYTCDISSDYWRDEGECREYDSILEGGCCIYEPKVTIVDSWGNSKTENLGNCANGKDCSVIIVPK